MSNIKFKEWLNIWSHLYKKPFVNEKTFNEILRYIRYLKGSSLANLPLKDITTQNIQEYLNLYSRSRNKEILSLYLNSALEKAFDLGYIPLNPFKAIVKDKKIKSIRYSLNFQQQKALLRHIKGKSIEELVYFYLLTGCRLNEALRVKFSDIDIKTRELHIKGTKTSSSDRYIKISKKYIKHLLSLPKKGKYIFNYNAHYISHKITSYFKTLQINACTHSLRHTFSTNQMYLGTPDKYRQAWLGHSTMQMTNEVYTHIDNSLTRKNICKLYKKYYFYVRL